MEENYLLSVCGKQFVNGNSDKVELQTNASYVMRGSSRYITYKEYDPQDPQVHYRTTVKVDENNVVTVIKGGEMSHNLILEQGQRHRCEYRTPYGNMTLGIYTERVEIELDDNGGSISVSYNIYIENERASSNELVLNIKEAKGHVNGTDDSTEA